MRNISKLALTAALGLALAFTFNCSGGGDGGGDNPANNNTGGNNGGDATHDGKVITADGEAWMELKSNRTCATLSNGTDGVEFKSNGDMFRSDYRDGVFLERDGKKFTWRTNGNTMTLAG